MHWSRWVLATLMVGSLAGCPVEEKVISSERNPTSLDDDNERTRPDEPPPQREDREPGEPAEPREADTQVRPPATRDGNATSEPTEDATSEPPIDPGPTEPADPCGGHQLASATWVNVTAPVTWNTHADRVPFNTHMTYQGDPATTIALQWATTEADLDAYVPRVWLAPMDQVTGEGEDAEMAWSEAGVWEGTGERYRESLLGQELGEIDWVTWTVLLDCLSPNTTYAYRVGSWESVDLETGEFIAPDLSPMGTFTTGPVAGDDSPFELVMAGDSRGGTDKIREHMPGFLSLPADMWFFNGDMSNGGTQPEWSDWMDAMGPLLAAKPLMPVQGNHEVFANVYYAQFALPIMSGLEPEMVEHAWGFTYGNAHFIGLDSNTEDTVVAQTAWLEAHLASIQDDPNIDWIFAMMHHPAYSACTNHGSTQRVRTHWVPIFEAYGVDLVFSGHDHNYERSHPVHNGEVVAPDEGVVYVVAGAFGAPPYTNGSDWWTAHSVHGDVGNYVHVAIEGKRLEITAYSMDGTQTLDSLVIEK
ncbi:MAG: purple acid phosphatase family protein [Myxococcota bacterium]